MHLWVCASVCVTTGFLLSLSEDMTQRSESRQRGLCWVSALRCPRSSRQETVCWWHTHRSCFTRSQTGWRRENRADWHCRAWGVHRLLVASSVGQLPLFKLGTRTHIRKQPRDSLYASTHAEWPQAPCWPSMSLIKAFVISKLNWVWGEKRNKRWMCFKQK